MSPSGALTWASMYRMCWVWSEWLVCPVLLMLGNTRSPVGELFGPNTGGHCVARWLPTQGPLPLSAFLSPVFNYGVCVLVLGYHGGLKL